MIELGMYQNELGYVMTFKEAYVEILDAIDEHFSSLGINRWSTVCTEAKLAADGIMRQIELFGEYSYKGKKWKRFV